MWNVPVTGVLVKTLLDRGEANDVTEAEAAINRLAVTPGDDGLAVRDMRLRALLARARGETATYKDFRESCRDMANSLGFEGHIAWAETMP